MAFNQEALKRAKHKSKETELPALLSAASILLRCHTLEMNSHQTLTGLQLKRGGVTKQAITRLHARGLCISYKSILNRQIELGKDFDDPVKLWSTRMSEDKKIEEEKMSTIQSLKTEQAADKEGTLQREEESLQQHRQQQHPGFKIITDNVDLRISPRQMTIQHGNKDLHYCNTMAVKNKVGQIPMISMKLLFKL